MKDNLTALIISAKRAGVAEFIREISSDKDIPLEIKSKLFEKSLAYATREVQNV